MKTVLLLWCVPLFLSAIQDPARTIISLQDSRIDPSKHLEQFLRSDNDRERERALLAIANIQDTGSVDLAAPFLSDPAPSVRSMAAFALGMINKPRCATLLFRRLAVERDEQCIADILNAIGMCGSQEDLRKLIAQSEHFPAAWRSWTALSIARFANRRIRDISASRYAAALMADNATVINAVYAVMRINDTLIIRSNRARLTGQLQNTSFIVRMWSASALTALDDAETVDALSTTALSDKDWRVRVNAVRALRNRTTARGTIIKAIRDKNEHVGLSAVAAYENIAESANDSLILGQLLSNRTLSSTVREELRIVAAKLYGASYFPSIGGWKSTDRILSARRIKAYGATNSEQAIPFIKEALQSSPSSVAVIAGIESYQQIARSADENVQKDFLKTAVLMLGRNDAGISYTAALAFRDTAFSTELRKVFLSALITSFGTMKESTDLEPMVELLKVFGEIGDTTALPSVTAALSAKDKVIRSAASDAYRSISGEDPPEAEYHADRSQPGTEGLIEDLKRLDEFRGAVINTSKGKIRITFEKEAAPFTVLNFIRLSEKKFYDGLSFHRVVNNFVIQGGDPLGNGSGGPEYSIRTEVHPRTRFKSGAVGMASAGKDTEGSQWFITHCPTPHLDFRYTVFGYTPDAKVVDQVMIGDSILSVELVKEEK